MHDPQNPQAEQMVHESMLRTLALQAEAIWPQESRLFDRYDIPSRARILDVACGIGEITHRLADRYTEAEILGIDIEDQLLDVARQQTMETKNRVRFAVDNAFALDQPENTFDLTICRHLLQIIPEPIQVVAEATRVTKPGGWIHMVVEDYGMVQFSPTMLENDEFWLYGPVLLGDTLNTDMRVGRSTFGFFYDLGIEDIAVDYVVVDTLRTRREVFIALWEAWRDGYTDVIARQTRFSHEEVSAHWDDMLNCLRNPAGYAVWQVPVVSGRVPWK